MRQSNLFTKTRKETPKDEVAKNATLLIRAGFINKEMAGAYSYLPLGLRVLGKIEAIIREEMNNIGGQEVSMTALQDPRVWKETGRWSDEVVDIWFKTKLASDSEVGLGFTHEEPITEMLKHFVSSYKDLPFSLYQFQTKFRNELRASSGIMRGREFLMKDLYSFNLDEESHQDFYERAKGSYKRIFERVGLGEKTYLTLASGGSFSEYSHEFQTICEAGEDTVYITDEEKKEAVNKEIEDKNAGGLRAVEVGNIFTLGTKFSEALGLNYKDEKGDLKPVFMGSYGIGLGRLMGTVVEVLSDEKGIVWPKEISPFAVHLLSLADDDTFADEVYERLQKAGVEVLYDDRSVRAGEKFADAELIGIPVQVIVGNKARESQALEIKDRSSGEIVEMSIESFIAEENK